MPLTNFSSFELKPKKFSAPWLPEISMTVRFRPVGNDEVNLLRMQVAEVKITMNNLPILVEEKTLMHLCLIYS